MREKICSSLRLRFITHYDLGIVSFPNVNCGIKTCEKSRKKEITAASDDRVNEENKKKTMRKFAIAAIQSSEGKSKFPIKTSLPQENAAGWSNFDDHKTTAPRFWTKRWTSKEKKIYLTGAGRIPVGWC